MARNSGTNYFEMMEEMVRCACDAAEKLEHILKNFDLSLLEQHMEEIHAIEHKGDELKHALVEKLAKEFITPIEREDIMAISDQVDDVIDCVEDVLLKIYMFNIKEIRPMAITFAGIIRQCCAELDSVFHAFADFKKSKTIHVSIIEINRLEELGDSLYVQAVRELYDGKTDPLSAFTWTDVYNGLERCCDTCEHSADLVENVILKNS